MRREKPRTRARTKMLALPSFAIASLFVTVTGANECIPESPALGAVTSPFFGVDLENTHFAASESRLSPSNVERLVPKWTFRTTGSVSSSAALSERHVYFTSAGAPRGGAGLPGGCIYAVDVETGDEVWSHRIVKYAPNKLYNLSRSSPAIADELLIFGDWLEGPIEHVGGVLGLDPGPFGTHLYAVRRSDGELVWKTTLDVHPMSSVAQSPVVHNGRVYVGVASRESADAELPYPCCSFRGSMLSLDLYSGVVIWKTYMVPDNRGRTGGYSGGAVSGSAPAIDEARGVVYVSTGHNYDVPETLKRCIHAHEGRPEVVRSECLERLDPEENRSNSVVALDLLDGEVRWSKKLSPNPTRSDFDFGQAPMLVRAGPGGPTRDLVVIGQRSGVFWGLDPDRLGEVVWMTIVGPGGVHGGMELGAATDGRRIYAQIANMEHSAFALTAGRSSGETAVGGIWAALDADTGTLLWQTPDPSSRLPLTGTIAHPEWGEGLGKGFFGVAIGPLTVANGLLFAGSMDSEGHMYALNAATGAILWRFASGGSVMSAPAIHGGVVYWGSGSPLGFDNDRFFAFALSH